MVSVNSLLEIRCNALAAWLEENANHIPNIQRLVNKLKNNKTEGHLVHGGIVKKLLQSNKFGITDIECSGNGYDVDIELNNNVNIQVWHGASTSTYNIVRGKNISEYGGVAVDWDKDEQKILKKLAQLPAGKPGLLLCYNYHLGIIVLPERTNKISNDHVLAEMFHVDYGNGAFNEAKLYHSQNFKHLHITKEVLGAIGFGVKEI